MLRIDSTMTKSPIHAPSDSTLLLDSVRVLVRLLKEAGNWLKELPASTVGIINGYTVNCENSGPE